VAQTLQALYRRAYTSPAQRELFGSPRSDSLNETTFQRTTDGYHRDFSERGQGRNLQPLIGFEN
jgi:hypothetical protein